MIHPSLVVLSVVLLAASPALQAATYKCSVDGKTVYQQSPCAEAQGQVLNLPSNTVGGGQSYSGSDVAKMRQEVQNNGTPLARDAFERIVGGQIDVYVANLCPREREQWSNPTLKGSISAMGKILAGEQLRLGRQTEATMDSLSFVAVQMPGQGTIDTSVKPRMRSVHAHFGRDMGRLCLRVLSFGT